MSSVVADSFYVDISHMENVISPCVKEKKERERKKKHHQGMPVDLFDLCRTNKVSVTCLLDYIMFVICFC